MKHEKEEDDDPKKEGDESPTKMDVLPLDQGTSKDHPIDKILGDITKGVTTLSKTSNLCYHFASASQVEPKKMMRGTLSHFREIIKL